MINKFPKTAASKWQRYTNIERGFMIYIVLLILSILIFPVYHINWGGVDKEVFRLFDIYSISTSIFIIFCVVFLIFWNISFRFKKIIYILLGFKENDALVNFGILLILIVSYISIADAVLMIGLYDAYVGFSSGYYISGLLLIFGLIRNIVLAIDLSTNKKKNRMINIKSNLSNNKDDDQEKIKSLFDK
ncbi:hypothetical protein [Candidatus Vampirococcus lugosii]|uniref:Uncharacterized protein n=1 Tax=Candidatus Vampirococcus lugosii TaxID=2789015 RepID=A0ABS5QK22_9BACT|nr:hypothetical protein [Candidatus Vampirococcus lugosii]MBS8121582.1 hypothetical protein [Candidatus Vampirococcus lugosii]